jgi:hypothetical protein
MANACRLSAAELMAAAAAARITIAVAPDGRLSVEYPASAEALANEIFERKAELIAHLEALRTNNGEPVPKQVPSVLSVLSTATLPETFDTDPTGRRTCGVCRTPTARVGQSGLPLHGWCETGESPGRYLDRIARPSSLGPVPPPGGCGGFSHHVRISHEWPALLRWSPFSGPLLGRPQATHANFSRSRWLKGH